MREFNPMGEYSKTVIFCKFIAIPIQLALFFVLFIYFPFIAVPAIAERKAKAELEAENAEREARMEAEYAERKAKAELEAENAKIQARTEAENAEREAKLKAEIAKGLTDPRDRKKYKIINIGSQIWMAENLNYTTSNSKCYDNKPANCAKYGRLYDWDDAMKACPKGWHLPSNAEWQTLVDFVGGDRIAGKKLKSRSGWNGKGDGTDEYGFSALPGGDYTYAEDGRFHDGSEGIFDDVGDNGRWWSASEYLSGSAYYRSMSHNGDDADGIDIDVSRLFSVRCLRNSNQATPESEQEDKMEEPKSEQEPPNDSKGGNFTDSRDGKEYKYVKIGTQTWMAENLNYATSGSKCHANKSAKCAKYGRLYDWDEAIKACPKGWHLPSREEWKTLANLAGGGSVAGKKLKSKSGWDEKGNGTDEYGFSALPGGNGYSDDSFGIDGSQGHWWSTNEKDSDFAYIVVMFHNNGDIGLADYDKSALFSVRCVKK